MGNSLILESLQIEEVQRLALRAEFDAIVFADLLGVNLRTLERRCRKISGCTPRAALEHIRLNLAHQLIQRGLRTKEVANLIGYKRASHLCDRIRCIYGIPPRKLKCLPIAYPLKYLEAFNTVVVRIESSALGKTIKTCDCGSAVKNRRQTTCRKNLEK
jgi:AraC-like DNA-binding protein